MSIPLSVLDQGFIIGGGYKGPPVIDPGDFTLRKGLRTRLLPREPSAIDRLAALADPKSEIAERVRQWERTGGGLYYGTATVDNL